MPINPIPHCLLDETNRQVLHYLSGLSAHSDVADVLSRVIAPLGAANSYCPDAASYRYLCVYAQETLFGFASGMQTIAFRLSPELRTNAVATGANPLTELGAAWVTFELFRTNWPTIDLESWARKAYLFATGADDS